MAEAIFSRLVSQKTINPDKITVTDVDIDRLDFLQEKYLVKASLINGQAITGADVIILSVKPQQIEAVLTEIGSQVENKLVISIAAGIKIAKIEDKLPEAKVIRVMPNTAALVGQAISAISKGGKATDSDIDIAKQIFNAVGEVVEVDENLQNAVTAISGSGPAYFFYLTELLAEAAASLGLSEILSRKLADQTMVGAAQLLKTKKTPQELRKMVTSPGGTTEAAIKSFEEDKLSDIVQRAVRRARGRSEELSG